MNSKGFIEKNIFLIVIVIVLILLVSYAGVRNYLASKTKYTNHDLSSDTYEIIPKTYGVNEYSNIIISDEDMARIYLNDYVINVSSDIRKSYDLLDEEYRNKKFGSVDNYISYLSNMNFYNSVDKYYKIEKGDYTVYGVYDMNGNLFIFKASGVMQYKVYFDKTTIGIW